MYHWSVQVSVGNGCLTSFWYDNWGEKPLRGLKDGRPRPPLQSISLAEAWPIVQALVPEAADTLQITFTDQEDELRWRWNANGIYSASSFYKIMIEAGLIQWRFEFIWKANAPLKVKLFTLLLLKKRILTHDVMVRRGFQCDLQCAMCVSDHTESALHLCYHCQYATRVWEEVQRLLGRRILVNAGSVQQIWDKSWDFIKLVGGMSRKKWATIFMCVSWHLWKQRNEKIFRGIAKPPCVVAKLVVQEFQLWMKFCSVVRREGIG